MRKVRWFLIAMLVILPFAAVSAANAQVGVGVGVGPAVVESPAYYGPPDCSWGYYSYYPYACAPYGYYGPSWFAGGLFIGVGPWYGWGRGGYGYAGRGYVGGAARGYAGGAARGYAGGGVARGYSGGAVAHGYSSGGGGFHGGGGGGGFHGGGGGGRR